MEPMGRCWNPKVWTEHVFVLIAPSLDVIDVLQEKLAPFVSELNTHLAQKWEENPREGGSIVCLGAIHAKEMSRQINDNVYELQKHLGPCPDVLRVTIHMSTALLLSSKSYGKKYLLQSALTGNIQRREFWET